jgi:hypothetical protein
MKAEESFTYIKAVAYLIIAGMVVAIVYKIFKKISNFLKSKEEEATEFGQEIESGEDYLEPNVWKKIIPKGKNQANYWTLIN